VEIEFRVRALMIFAIVLVVWNILDFIYAAFIGQPFVFTVKNSIVIPAVVAAVFVLIDYYLEKKGKQSS